MNALSSIPHAAGFRRARSGLRTLLIPMLVLLAACSGTGSDGTGATAPATAPSPAMPPEASAEPETVEEVFALIASLGLDAAATDAYLLERARDEGSVTLYLNSGGGVGEEIAQAWSEAFAASYPGLGLQFVALSPTDFNPRVLSEHRAGRPQADIVRTSASLLAELEREGILTIHAGLLGAAGAPSWSVTPTGVIGRVTPTVIPWNAERVPPGNEPRDWDAFLTPEHAGCVLGPTPSWVVGMIEDRGLPRTEQWFEGFLANGGLMVIENGPSLLRKLVAGEVDCVVHVNAGQAESARASGAPVEWLLPAASPGVVTAFSVLSTTPRPHAAALFVRWAVGQQGAQIASDLGEFAVRADVTLSSERFLPFADPSSAEFSRVIVIDNDMAGRLEQQAADLLARYHTPNVIQR
jgi:iron(III) transport system substrate-binding protein